MRKEKGLAHDYFSAKFLSVSEIAQSRRAERLTITHFPNIDASTLPNTALSGPAYGFTAPRNFHANNVTVRVHYEF
jgi:hypothetical protein